MKQKLRIGLLSLLGLIVFFTGSKLRPKEIPWDLETADGFSLSLMRKKLRENIKDWSPLLQFQDHEYLIKYTLNDKLMAHISELLKHYRSDYTSVTVLDNDTGNILGLMDFSREKGDLGMGLTLTGHHPSASIFKIITSAQLLQNTHVKKDSVFQYLGRSTTLFKYQLRKRGLNSWMREQTFEEAFAKSNNVVFGKAALNNANRQNIVEMARNLGFNEDLMEELNLPLSQVYMPEDNFGLAELATGFNRGTTMTTVHGAMLSSIVANNGVLKYPKVIGQIREKGTGNLVWRPVRDSRVVLKPQTAEDLQDMMELTVKMGTAKKVFRNLNKKMRNMYRIGGKTGSITGGEPFGRRDWFTVFAKPNNSDNNVTGKGISVCVMIVNQKKWYVKSSFIAKNIIEYYYNSIHPTAEKS